MTNINDVVIGIDLGTTYSCVAIFKNNNVEIISNSLGNRTTPSWVSFTDSEILIGEAAKNLYSTNTTNTIYDIKRLIGKSFSDPDIQNEIKQLTYKIIGDDNDRIKVEVLYKGETKQYYPEQISGMILQHMKKIAESYLGESVSKAVVTVPAYFNDRQRQSTKDAGALAELNIIRIINEPTASSIAYGMDENVKDTEKNIVVFDMGGGTHDISILTLDNGVFEVRSTNGNTRLGGEDFDNRLIYLCLDELKKKHKVDLSSISEEKMNKIKSKLHYYCENAKRQLSSTLNATIEIDSLYEGIDFTFNISRAKFETLCIDLFMKSIDPLDRALKDAKLSKSEINEIVLVGGSTRIPKVQELLALYFNIEVSKLCNSINPDEAVAHGAAVQAAILNKTKSDKIDSLLLLDVTPLSLGVETSGQFMTVLIPRNTSIPVTKTQTFTTHMDNQTTVSIKIYEGERQMTKDCNLLGEFELTDIPPMPKERPEIEITYDLDANGILNVNAVEKSSKKINKIVITNDKSRLSKEEIDKIIEEAAKYKEEDEKYKLIYESKNNLESCLFSISNSISNEKIKEKLSDSDKEKLESKINEITEFLEKGNITEKEDYENKQKEIEDLYNPIIKKIYEDNPDLKENNSDGQPNMADMFKNMPGLSKESDGMPDMAGMAGMADMFKNMQGLSKENDSDGQPNMVDMFKNMQGLSKENDSDDQPELSNDSEDLPNISKENKSDGLPNMAGMADMFKNMPDMAGMGDMFKNMPDMAGMGGMADILKNMDSEKLKGMEDLIKNMDPEKMKQMVNFAKNMQNNNIEEIED